MSNVKKFRIKSFKEITPILELEKISLKFGRKQILDNLNLKLILKIYTFKIRNGKTKRYFIIVFTQKFLSK